MKKIYSDKEILDLSKKFKISPILICPYNPNINGRCFYPYSKGNCSCGLRHIKSSSGLI